MVEKEECLLGSSDEKEGNNPLISFPLTTPRLVDMVLVEPTTRTSRGPSRNDISLQDNANKIETRNQNRGICMRALYGPGEKACLIPLPLKCFLWMLRNAILLRDVRSYRVECCPFYVCYQHQHQNIISKDEKDPTWELPNPIQPLSHLGKVDLLQWNAIIAFHRTNPWYFGEEILLTRNRISKSELIFKQ